MRSIFRNLVNNCFTALSTVSVVLLVSTLVLILGPMIWRGSKALLFTSTVEYRKMQLDLFGRGNEEKIAKEVEQVEEFRKYVYEKIDTFKEGIDTEQFADRVKAIYRQYSDEMRDDENYKELRSLARVLRKELEDAFDGQDKAEVMAALDGVTGHEKREAFAGTCGEEFFVIAAKYKNILEKMDFSRRAEYAKGLREVQETVRAMFGPRPGEDKPPLAMYRFGATRLDQALNLKKQLLYDAIWVENEAGGKLVQEYVARSILFAGTEINDVLVYVDENFEKLFNPEFTFYWRYFIDDSTPGYYFGGVGPEILGTLLLTVLAMVFAFPLAVISAAYLVECAADNFIIRIIRLCINTLAGVPSIVFGLFGLAFFVLYCPGAINWLFGKMSIDATIQSKPSILAASLTLAVLTLPVMIRASEEAIRAVPHTYKEASLGLGAGGLRTFVQVTFPAALPGILTGVILSLSRVAGETAPILFTGAVALGPLPKSILDPTRTLSYGSYGIAVTDKIAMMVPHKQYGMVVTLILMIIVLNLAAILLRARAFKKLRGH